MEAGFWTQATWPGPRKGPIWEQSPTDISAVQICYRNEYHCCLGGPAPELKWWMNASRKISPPDVRLLQSDWPSVKINMKEKCCLTTQTWLPGDCWFWSLVDVLGLQKLFSLGNGKIRNGLRCDFPGRHQGCPRRTWGLSAEEYSLLWSCKSFYQDCHVNWPIWKMFKLTNSHYNFHLIYERESVTFSFWPTMLIYICVQNPDASARLRKSEKKLKGRYRMGVEAAMRGAGGSCYVFPKMPSIKRHQGE